MPPKRLSGEMRQVLWIWAVTTVVGIVLVLNVHRLLPGLLPPVASPDAVDVNTTLGVFTILAVPVAMLVWVFSAYSLRKWGSREFPDGEGPAVYGHSGIQFGWLAGSATLCLALVVYGLVLLDNTTRALPGNNLVVDVAGQQWEWTFSYPQYGNATPMVLELPVNRPVTFRITSHDVTHSFWIPAMGVKVDANAGEVTTIYTEPTKKGTFVVQCAELCGLYHAYMQGDVRVVDAQAFADWVSRQRPMPAPAT